MCICALRAKSPDMYDYHDDSIADRRAEKTVPGHELLAASMETRNPWSVVLSLTAYRSTGTIHTSPEKLVLVNDARTLRSFAGPVHDILDEAMKRVQTLRPGGGKRCDVADCGSAHVVTSIYAVLSENTYEGGGIVGEMVRHVQRIETWTVKFDCITRCVIVCTAIEARTMYATKPASE